MTSSDESTYERLLRVFRRRDAAGQPLYADEDLRALLPLLAFGADGSEMNDALTDVMRDFAARLGLAPGMAPDEVGRRVTRYYEEHPLPKALLDDVRAAVRSDAPFVDTTAAAKALGSVVTKTPVGHEQPPKGATKASPLARFTLRRDD